ncbi:MAG TPA: hypothetical protein PK648_02345 [Verrucomicrobiales bacterium]|nr:hypothetical protein [Verrucomicrobiales bacterium]
MTDPRPNYGITRIDQPEKKNHGFYVRISHKGKSHQKYFPDKSLGGKTKALKAAKAHRDEILAKMPKYKQEAAAKKKRRIQASGVVGVTHVVSKSPNGTPYEYWQAAWLDADGGRRTAKFSISRYGADEALKMAKKAKRDGSKKKKRDPEERE